MKKILTLILTGAIALGAVSIANAGEEVQTEEFTISPTELGNAVPQNIQFVNTITTFDVPGTNQPPSATRTVIDLPKQFKLNLGSVPFCETDAAGLELAADVFAAKERCGEESVVSEDSGSTANVRVDVGPTTPPLVIDIQVVAFNENGNKLLLYSKPVGDFAGIPASIIVGEFEDSTAGSAYDKALDITIPPLAAGAFSLFKLTIKKSSYIQAKCDPTTLQAQATTYFDDGATSTDDHSVECTPVIDATPPNTTIDSGPSGATTDNHPTFTFSSDEPGSTFECRLDGPGAATGSFASCASPKSYTALADGDYTFQVRATDPASNTDPTPASRAFTVDTTPPNTTIDAGPSGTTNDNAPTFTFSSDEPGSTFECKVDSGPFGACSGPGESNTTFALADGPHAFEVRATDPAGHTDLTPASRAFTVDTALEGSATAKKTQKQKGKRVVVNAKVTAGESLDAKASGKVKLGKKSYKLKPASKSVSSGKNKNLKLKPKKSKDAKKIAKALKQGKKAKAKLTVKLTDEAGNKRTENLEVKLKR